MRRTILLALAVALSVLSVIFTPPKIYSEDILHPTSTTTIMDEPIKGAAMMLVTKEWRTERGRKCWFNASMASLEKYWYPTNPYPIILARQDRWDDWEVAAIKDKFPNLELRFESVNSAFYDRKAPATLEDNGTLGPEDYKRMCRFKSYSFLKMNFIKELDYLFGLDDDSCLQGPVGFDVFREMKKRSVVYAFKQLFNDPGYVVKGLYELGAEFMKNHHYEYANKPLHEYVKKGHKKENDDIWAFSTNLDWMDLNSYRSPKLQEYFDAIEESDMIFHRRWGDSPIRFSLAFMFWGRDEVMKLCTPFQHSIWPNSTSKCDKPFVHDAVLKTLEKCGAYCDR